MRTQKNGAGGSRATGKALAVLATVLIASVLGSGRPVQAAAITLSGDDIRMQFTLADVLAAGSITATLTENGTAGERLELLITGLQWDVQKEFELRETADACPLANICSDRLWFDNVVLQDGTKAARIAFLSDNSMNILPTLRDGTRPSDPFLNKTSGVEDPTNGGRMFDNGFTGNGGQIKFNMEATSDGDAPVQPAGRFTLTNVPEPSTWLLLATGVGLLAYARRRMT